LLWNANVAWGCYNRKKLLQTPKVAKKLPSTIGEGLVASDRLGALFGVSILEDKGARTQSVMGYRVSNVKWSVIFFVWVYFDEEKPRKSYISYWISDSESCQRLMDLRYEILLFISYNYNVHRHYLRILSCGCWPVVAAKIWILRARDLYWIISFQCRQILVKINNSNFE
jgi:hypothetical protein